MINSTITSSPRGETHTQNKGITVNGSISAFIQNTIAAGVSVRVRTLTVAQAPAYKADDNIAKMTDILIPDKLGRIIKIAAMNPTTVAAQRCLSTRSLRTNPASIVVKRGIKNVSATASATAISASA